MQVTHIVEVEAFGILLLDVLHVLAVIHAKHHIGDAGTLGSQYLLLHAADGNHLATQRDLSRHSHTGTHTTLCQRRDERGHHSDACRRSILRNGAFGAMDMYCPVFEDGRVDAEVERIGLHPLQGKLCRFLHHVAQMASERKVLLAGHKRRFHLKDAAAHRCPGQARDDACIVVAVVFLGIVVRLAEEVYQVVRLKFFGHGHLVGHTPRHLAHHLGQGLVEQSHAALTGVLVDNLFHRAARDVELDVSQAVLLLLLGQEVTFADLDLLFKDIARKLDHLHTVEQGCCNGRKAVGGGDEEHLRKVVIHIEEVVVEGLVLFRVKHLEQGARRIALEVGRDLVNLIQHEHRIVGLRLLDARNDASGQGADIGAAMSAYLCLVVQTAQRDAHIFALQRRGDALAERCLAHAWRAYKAEDG